MSALSFFPTPLPDETLYSVVGRYHRLGGFADDRSTSTKLFGNANSGFMHDFPCGIDTLCLAVDGWAEQHSSIIRKYTILPFYEPFLSEDALQEVIEAMRHGKGERIKFILGLTASRLDATHPLRACPTCLQEDTTRHGAAYWHRAHQLPCVHVCDYHAIPLVILPLKTNRLSKQRFLLPCDIARSDQIQATQSDKELAKCLLEFSRTARHLLDARLPSFDANLLQNIYREGAAAAGYMLKSGNIDQQRLKGAFFERFGPLEGIPEFTETIDSARSDTSFLASLLRKPRGQKHPIKHLLLIQLLYDGLPSFLTAARTDRAHIAQCEIRIRLRHSPTIGIDEATVARMRQLLLDENLPLRSATTQLGMTTSTLAIRAEQAGIPVKHRSKLLVPAFRKRIAADLQQGAMIKAVCARHHVSKSSVQRLLQADQGLRDAWEQARYLDERNNRRSQLQSLITANPASSRSELREALGAGHYHWLARNDKAWIESILPPQTRTTITKRRPAVDWAKRDRAFSAAVERIVDRMRKLSGKPVRLTRAAIYRAIPGLARKAANLSKMPATMDTIQRTIETTAAFHQRRLAWARSELARTDGAPSESRVNRLAGVARYTRRTAA